MAIIDKAADPVLFQLVTERNLLRQYDLLSTTVEVALKDPAFRLNHEMICELNRCAVLFLADSAGQYRRGPVYINGSNHTPPPWQQVKGLMDDLVSYLDRNWQSGDPIHLAAYTVWRLCWIHPFIEGNGRTARASSYLVLCLRHGMWLPGSNIVPKQIRENRGPYVSALKAADTLFAKTGGIDVSEMETYLQDLLTKQLS